MKPMTLKETVKTDISNWGTQPPHFIQLLANAVSESDRTQVAHRLGISRTSVSLLLSNKYTSPSVGKMKTRVMDVLGAIQCPVVGEITAAECQKHRNAKFTPSNPQRVALYRACQTCPNNQKCGETA